MAPLHPSSTGTITCTAATFQSTSTSTSTSTTTVTFVVQIATTAAIAVGTAAVVYAGLRWYRIRSLFRKYRDIETTPCPSVPFDVALKACQVIGKRTQGSVVIRGVMVDTRTPKEYNEAHVYNAINIPLMSDYQRHVIGWTYKHRSRQAAIQTGKTFFAPAVQDFLNAFDQYQRNGIVVYVYCWRGGMRSQCVVNLLRKHNIIAYQVQGGFKSYMNDIVWKGLQQFGNKPSNGGYRPKFIVLFGNTGTRKTELLHALQAQQMEDNKKVMITTGHGDHHHDDDNNDDDGNGSNDGSPDDMLASTTIIPVLDLEGLAGHKGSLFGGIGTTTTTTTTTSKTTSKTTTSKTKQQSSRPSSSSPLPRSQKQFSILLYHRLDELKHYKYIFVEGEGQKIGNIYLPPFVYEKITKDIAVLVTASLKTRVSCIREQYFHNNDCIDQIRTIGKEDILIQKVGMKRMETLHTMLDDGQYDACIEWFLIHYYDVRYRFGKKGYTYALHVCSDDLDQCCNELVDFYIRLVTEGDEFVKQDPMLEMDKEADDRTTTVVSSTTTITSIPSTI